MVAYSSLASIHMWSAYQCVHYVPLASLNETRLNILIKSFQERQPNDKSALPSPLEIAKLELVPYWRQEGHSSIQIGFDIKEMSQGSGGIWLGSAVELHQNDMYLVSPLGDGRVGQLMKEGADTEACLKGYLHACILRDVMVEKQHMLLEEMVQQAEIESSLKGAKDSTESTWTKFNRGLGMGGWEVDRILMDRSNHEYTCQ